MPLYFNSQHLPVPSGEYVVWCDGMGTARALGTSLHHAANFVFKLHRAFDIALSQLPADNAVRVYPLMDGMYITTPSRQHVQAVLSTAFTELAGEFLSQQEIKKQFLVRAAVAYGPTLHGADIDDRAFVRPGPGNRNAREAFQQSKLNTTRQQLLLSPAMVSAFKTESLAPPFGIYVDDSALGIPQLVDAQDTGFPSILWKWWYPNQPSYATAQQLWTALRTYFQQALRNGRALGYNPESAKKHQGWATEYFSEFEPHPDA